MITTTVNTAAAERSAAIRAALDTPEIKALRDEEWAATMAARQAFPAAIAETSRCENGPGRAAYRAACERKRAAEDALYFAEQAALRAAGL
jgi:hypothetical protein